MPIEFHIATIEGSYLRMAIAGPSGSGKTLTALKLAKGLSHHSTVVIDTERDTAKLYANHSETPKPYYVFNLAKYTPQHYIKLLSEVAASADPYFDVCIIDSLTPSWNKTGGVLDIAGSDIRGWKTANPQYVELVEAVTGYNHRMHVICTLRSKMDYVIEPDPVTNKMRVTKHGMQPIHRDELPYEFDIVGQLDQDHVMSFDGVGKLRCDVLDGRTFTKPGKDLADILNVWLHGDQ